MNLQEVQLDLFWEADPLNGSPEAIIFLPKPRNTV